MSDEAVRAVLVGSRAFVGVAARSLADTDEVTLPQFRALVVLSTRSSATVGDLAVALDIHPTSATRLVDRLVRKGVVRRRASPDDRRVTLLEPSASGRRIVRRVTQRRVAHLAAILRRMPPAERAVLAGALAAFADAAGEPGDVDLFGWDALPA